MRTLFALGLALGLFAGTAGCENFNECNGDSDCPMASDGSKLYCTPDHICALGTPAAGLCTEIYPPNSPSNAVVVGALVDTISGNDKLPLEAFKLGIDEVNARRSPDPPLALHVCEIGATADDPLKSMEVLARQRNAVAVLGPTSSSYVFDIQPEVIRSGIPIMSPSATSPEISSLGDSNGPVNGLFYRVVPDDALQGPVLAHQLPRPFTGKLALLFVNDQYGTGLKDAFLGATAKQPDLTVSYEEPPGGPDLTGTQNAANMIINFQPDFTIAITNLYSDTVVKDLETLKLPTAPTVYNLIMADGAKNQNVLNIAGPPTPPAAMITHLNRIAGTAPTVDLANITGTGAYPTFVNDFKTRWTDDPTASIYTTYAYDAVYAVAIAIGAAGENVTPSAVSQMLGHINQFDPNALTCQPTGTISNGNQIVVGQPNYLAAKNKVAAGAGLVMQGATGTICFNPHGDRVSGLYEQWSINTTASPPKFNSTPTQ